MFTVDGREPLALVETGTADSMEGFSARIKFRYDILVHWKIGNFCIGIK